MTSLEIKRLRAFNQLKAACSATRDPEVIAAYYDYAMADAKVVLAGGPHSHLHPKRLIDRMLLRKWWRWDTAPTRQPPLGGPVSKRIRHFEIIRSRNWVAVWLWGASLVLRVFATDLGNPDLIAVANVASTMAAAWLTYLTARSWYKPEREQVNELELLALGRAAQHHDPTTCTACKEDQ